MSNFGIVSWFTSRVNGPLWLSAGSCSQHHKITQRNLVYNTKKDCNNIQTLGVAQGGLSNDFHVFERDI